MSDTHEPNGQEKLSRRDFIQAAAVAGAGFSLSQAAFAQGGATSSTTVAPASSSAPLAKPAPAILKAGSSDVLNVAIIGTGQQGRVIIDACRGFLNLNFKAVCDIWKYSKQFGAAKLRAYGHKGIKVYEDYREMLAQEKDLDAVIVATPDWMHAEQTIACLERGLHVYCEKAMSNDLEHARQMVLAARRTGKLLQIGLQRRSNPRYLHARDKIVHSNRLLGRVGQVNAQWTRSIAQSVDLKFPQKLEIPPETLSKYGYASMHEFLNWRWFKKYGGGPALDLGTHQLDVVNWFLDARPKSMTAMGGVDTFKSHEWYDNIMCLMEYETAEGPVRAFYQVLITTGHGGYFETFMGEEGSMVMSEQEAITVLRPDNSGSGWEQCVKWSEWEQCVKAGILRRVSELKQDDGSGLRREPPPPDYSLPVQLTKPFHQPHLENFFDAIRHGTLLNCPGETGYATTATALAINRAVENREKIEFKPEDFIVA